ncbi:transposable element Tcb1 transposase [Trichonephila clavipes]|nr:transposable element Tcb1 transposase [Trichonephila clavipes]
MSSPHHIDDFMRGRIIGKIEEGRKTARGGRVRSTTPAEDRYIVLSAKRNRRTIAQQVANQFLAASEKQISRKTVARRLRGGGLYACRPIGCVPLTRQHRTPRLQWYHIHGRTLSHNRFNMLWLPLHCRSSVTLEFEPATHRPQVPDHDYYALHKGKTEGFISILEPAAVFGLKSFTMT